jgi:hypothetical protein
MPIIDESFINNTNGISYGSIMLINKITRPFVWVDYADLQMNPTNRRGRFIAPIADVSASCLGLHHILPILFIHIICLLQ